MIPIELEQPRRVRQHSSRGLTQAIDLTDWSATVNGTQDLLTIPAADEARFWSRVDKDAANGCWEWQGALSLGYGGFSIAGKQWRVHRLAYSLIVGAIPEGLVLDHLCRNRACVNPGHLEAVTDRVNVLRGIGLTAMQARQKRCKEGHEFTEENTYISTRRSRECRTCNAVRSREKSRVRRDCAICGKTMLRSGMARHIGRMHGDSAGGVR